MPVRPFVPHKVYLDGREVDYLKVGDIQVGLGGQSLDSCTLELTHLPGQVAGKRYRGPLTGYELSHFKGEILVVGSFQPGVHQLDHDDEELPREIVYHWGRASLQSLAFDARTDSYTITSRVEPFHFGTLTDGPWTFYLRDFRIIQQRGMPIVFNPLIDGKIEPNCESKVGTGGTLLFIDPESARTDAARTEWGRGGGKPSHWYLSTAILYLCQTLNRDQKYISCPTFQSINLSIAFLSGKPIDDESYRLQNVMIPNGIHLPEALDRLLKPFGFSWYLKHESRTKRTIEIVRRGYSDRNRVLKYPAPGAKLTATNANAPRNNITSNIAAVVNDLRVYGSFREWESTFELVRAWHPNYDDLDGEDLNKDDADSDYFDEKGKPGIQRVQRDYVLNEASDYTGLRKTITAPHDFTASIPELKRKPAKKPADPPGNDPDQDKHFEPAPQVKPDDVPDFTPRRRKFLPTISVNGDGSPLELSQTIEWSADDGDTWQPLESLEGAHCHLLARECGVRFDGTLPPQQLIEAGDKARVRITATIRTDRRLSARVLRASRQADHVEATVDADDRFHYRQVSEKSVLRVSGGPTRAVDDTTQIELYAGDLMDSWNMPDMTGSVTIEGLDGIQYQLGDIITDIVGRDIDLTAFESKKDRVSKFPQIVQIKYDLENQTRTLQLQTFRDPVSHVRSRSS